MPQRRTVFAGLAAATLLPVFGRAYAAGNPVEPDSLATQAGDLVIQPVNHASLVLSFGSDIIYVDPVGGGARYTAFNKPTSIVITHAHPDHFDVATLEALGPSAKLIIGPQQVIDALPADLKARSRPMKNGDTGDIDGIPLAAIPAYNITPERLKYHPKGDGNGYVFSFGGGKVYVAGDTEDTPEMRALVGIGVAFIPMNLPYTMSGEQAAAAVMAFKPQIVYPYHYGKGGPEPARFVAALKTPDIDVRLRDWYAYS
ncbi:MAG: MBL fold metallo-hydrolase [Devosia sp.]|nr:MBL fold metallo-hydrolase [Devosia sp.]